MKTSEEQMDLLLFEYVERTLRDEKAMEIESSFASDPLAREELTFWESSIVREGFSDTSELEDRILQRTFPSFSFTVYLNSILLGCLCFLSSSNLDIKTATHVPTHFVKIIEPEEPVLMLQGTKTSLTPEWITATVQFRKIAFDKKPFFQKGINTMDFTQIATLKIAHMDMANLTSLPPLQIKKIDRDKANLIAPKSFRKQNRSVRKMQDKAAASKMAAEYKKGNIPYVVPIDPKNF